MPRYFFDVHDGCDVIDNNGRDLADLATAKDAAAHIATAYASAPKIIAKDGGALVVVVRDELNDVVLKARLVLSLETRRVRAA